MSVVAEGLDQGGLDQEIGHRQGCGRKDQDRSGGTGVLRAQYAHVLDAAVPRTAARKDSAEGSPERPVPAG